MFNFDKVTTIAHLISECEHQYSEEDLSLIQRAADFAGQVHKDSYRISGQTWMEHCLTTAAYIARLNLDANSVAAAVLHDTIETGGTDLETLSSKFNDEVALLVDGLSYVRTVSSRQVSNMDLDSFRKLIIKSADDIRVLLIRLAEKVEGIQNMNQLPEQTQQEMANRALNVYSRLCEYVGLNSWQGKLESRAFQIKNPEKYEIIYNAIITNEQKYQGLFDSLEEEIRDVASSKVNIKEISYRRKSVYSAYRKIKRKHLKPNEQLNPNHVFELNDLLGLRIIVKTVEDCYLILSLLHAYWDYDPDEFDDYIITPRASGYQSIHTVVYVEEEMVDIQIRTWEMHEFAEFGPASHVAYKETKTKSANNATSSFEWLKQLQSWKSRDNQDRYRMQAFAESKFVFTPKGMVIRMPQDASVLDFAFQVHTALGFTYRGALVNGKMVSIDFVPRTGDVVEIITSKHQKVGKDWLQHTTMRSSREKIRKWLRQNDPKHRIKQS